VRRAKTKIQGPFLLATMATDLLSSSPTKVADASFALLRILLVDEKEVNNSSHGKQDGRVVVIIALSLLILVISVCACLGCCGGSKLLTLGNFAESNDAYQRRVLERQRRLEEARQMTPREKKKKIMRSLEHNQVRMVRECVNGVECSSCLYLCCCCCFCWIVSLS
jgi:small-conductance mechanosensitive channel